VINEQFLGIIVPARIDRQCKKPMGLKEAAVAFGRGPPNPGGVGDLTLRRVLHFVAALG
jgi:hypothetical protein